MAKAFSAPGKALLAGGYLVLDPKYSAYVVALSARMHAVVEAAETAKGTITVRSPQFKDGEWTYQNGQLSRPNPFVKAAIEVVLAYAAAAATASESPKISDLTVTIYSDDGYHSQSDNSQSPSKDRFSFHTVPINEVPKTGLGSSAALTAVLTAALLSLYVPNFSPSSPTHLQLAHNLAQIAHCRAQNKVGSGFDVASAVYGSIEYRRFPANLLGELMTVPDFKTAECQQSLKQLADSTWSVLLRPCSLPKGLSVLMGDVRGGSETPKMVSKLLAWRAANQARADEIWGQIDAKKEELVEIFTTLESSDPSVPDDYPTTLDASLPKLSKVFHALRHSIRQMSAESDVPVEPKPQTDLLDLCEQLPGVIGGVVPGAGGYDAISLLVKTDAIDSIITATRQNSQFSAVTWLDLQEQKFGLLEADPAMYPKA